MAPAINRLNAVTEWEKARLTARHSNAGSGKLREEFLVTMLSEGVPYTTSKFTRGHRGPKITKLKIHSNGGSRTADTRLKSTAEYIYQQRGCAVHHVRVSSRLKSYKKWVGLQGIRGSSGKKYSTTTTHSDTGNRTPGSHLNILFIRHMKSEGVPYTTSDSKRYIRSCINEN
ncbi:hypothetical protein C8R44DRAFT_745360 [Mycena epipterygia]|nr:hypothetical protein C8R44DRAFT_745360 [Mycena epipterygia]